MLEEEFDQRIIEYRNNQRTIQALTNAMTWLEATTPTETSRPRPWELPAPPKFNRTYEDLLLWKTLVNIKMTDDASQFTDNQHRLSHVFNLLEGKARNQIQDHVPNNQIDLVGISTLFAILD